MKKKKQKPLIFLIRVPFVIRIFFAAVACVYFFLVHRFSSLLLFSFFCSLIHLLAFLHCCTLCTNAASHGISEKYKFSVLFSFFLSDFNRKKHDSCRQNRFSGICTGHPPYMQANFNYTHILNTSGGKKIHSV